MVKNGKEARSIAAVIATGGLIRFFRGKVPGIDLFEPDLIFYGLKAIHDRHDRG